MSVVAMHRKGTIALLVSPFSIDAFGIEADSFFAADANDLHGSGVHGVVTIASN